jgi:hypothetical protein
MDQNQVSGAHVRAAPRITEPIRLSVILRSDKITQKFHDRYTLRGAE